MNNDNTITVSVPSMERQELEDRIKKFSSLSSCPDFKKITNTIDKQDSALKSNLRDIDSSFSPIVEDEHLWGLFSTNNYKESIVQVYERMKKFSKNALGAIKNTNDNLISTLNLLTILARTEKDLYELIDNSELKIQDVTDIIQEICDKNNIKDEKVKNVLEQTFKRSYTLRDRINGLRLQFDERLAEIDKHFADIQSEYEEKELHLQSIVEKGKTETMFSVEKEISKCREYLNTEIKNTDAQLKGFLNTVEQEINRIEVVKKELHDELFAVINKQDEKIRTLEQRCLALENKTFWEKASVNAAALLLGATGCILGILSFLI